MKDYYKIQLNTNQKIAYWWINNIRTKVKDIINTKTKDKKENEFADCFRFYTERDWRNIYLSLIDFITMHTNNLEGKSYLKQGLLKKQHGFINQFLQEYTLKNVPDISFTTKKINYTMAFNSFNAYLINKFDEIEDLPLEYDPSFILTGDEQELDLYSLMLATLYLISLDDITLKKVEDFRQSFCEIYLEKKNMPIFFINKIIKQFNQCFNKACNAKIILGKSTTELFFTRFKESDIAELQPYLKRAQYFKERIIDHSGPKFTLKQD